MNAYDQAAVPAYHDELLDAIHELDYALAAPAPRRERDWSQRVAKGLGDLHSALERHVLKAEAPRGVFAELEAAAPPLRHRIDRLKHAHSQLLRQIDSLETFVDDNLTKQHCDFREIRQRAGWLLTGVRHHMALAADLIFELYNFDIGVGD
jgi:hypothetical protein